MHKDYFIDKLCIKLLLMEASYGETFFVTCVTGINYGSN